MRATFIMHETLAPERSTIVPPLIDTRLRLFHTKYGMLILLVRPLDGTAISVLCEKNVLPANWKLPNGRMLGRKVTLRPGALIVPRRDPRQKGGALHHLIYPYGMYDALRACLYIRKNYDDRLHGEVILLESAYELLLCCLESLTAWNTLQDPDKTDLRIRLADLEVTFEKAVGHTKRILHERLAGAYTLKDRLRRLNPPAIEAKIYAARHYVRLRSKEIKAIDPRIGMRLITLVREIDRVHRTLIRVWKNLSRILYSEMHSRLEPAHAPHWIVTLDECTRDLQTIWVGPYGTLASRALKEIRGLRDAIAARQTMQSAQKDVAVRKAKKVVIEKTLVALRQTKARWVLEDIIMRDFPDARGPTPEEWIARVREELSEYRARLAALSDRTLEVRNLVEVRQLLACADTALLQRKMTEAKIALRKAARKL